MSHADIQQVLRKKETRLGIFETSSCTENYIAFLIVIRGLKSIDGLVIEESNSINELTDKIRSHSILDEVNVILVQKEEDRSIVTKILPSKKVFLLKDAYNVIPDIKFYTEFLMKIEEEYLKILGCRQTK